mmetsp:Transcript_17423/g.38018  ORF Transcript_17423/g.38018 Transcript_17423/m.38018 type:complete len:129 (-) Transcript_17423:256-642(-)
MFNQSGAMILFWLVSIKHQQIMHLINTNDFGAGATGKHFVFTRLPHAFQLRRGCCCEKAMELAPVLPQLQASASHCALAISCAKRCGVRLSLRLSTDKCRALQEVAPLVLLVSLRAPLMALFRARASA